MNGPNKLECYIVIGRKGWSGKTIWLVGPIYKSHGKWSVVITTTGAVFATLCFICNLRISLIARVFVLGRPFKPILLFVVKVRALSLSETPETRVSSSLMC